MERRFTHSITVFLLGIAFFALGAYLVQELIVKFLRFAIGLFLIFISIPMILGGIGMWKFFRRGRVVRFYRD